MATTIILNLVTDTDSVDVMPLLDSVLQTCDIPDTRVNRHSPVSSRHELASIYRQAGTHRESVVHALFDSQLRQAAESFSRTMDVFTIDLVSHLLIRLTDLAHIALDSRPNLRCQIDETYFRRIEAIEFAVAHDDGLRSHEMDKAEIVLVGVSRTSKTPLSMYLATHGWLVANVPIVTELAPPNALFQMPRQQVFALTIRPERLRLLRRVRISRLGLQSSPSYADLDYIRTEISYAQQIFRRGGWRRIDVTGKSIEESATEIVHLLANPLPDASQDSSET